MSDSSNVYVRMRVKNLEKKLSEDEDQPRNETQPRRCSLPVDNMDEAGKKLEKPKILPKVKSLSNMMAQIANDEIGGPVFEEYDGPDMAHPILLVETVDNKMQVTQEARDMLTSFVNISVISIVGKYRTGKSFILNRFFGANKGFELGSTTKSKTKGIWMWIKQHPIHQNSALALLDLEGFGDVKKVDKKHDMKHFSLAILLSRVVIYNIKNSIDEAVINEIDFVTDLAKAIKIKESSSDNEDDFGSHFPWLCFLIRDFHLDFEEGIETSDEYLEDCLSDIKDSKDHNRPRKCIRNFFPKRRCFTLCQPVENSKLKTIDRLSESEIAKEFLSDADKLTNEMAELAEPLIVNGSVMTARRFGELVKLYVDHLNTGSVLCVSSAMANMRELEYQKAYDEAIQIYRIMMDTTTTHLPMESYALSEQHRKAYEAATRIYIKIALVGDKDDDVKWKNVQEKIDQLYTEEYEKENSWQSTKKCDEVIAKCFATRSNNLKDGKYQCAGGYKMYEDDTIAAKEKYQKTEQKGPNAAEVLTKYMEDHYSEGLSVLKTDEILTEQNRKMEEEKEKRLIEEQKRCEAEQSANLSKMNLQMKEQERMFFQKLNETKLEEKDLEQETLIMEHGEMAKKKDEEVRRQLERGDQVKALVFEKERDEIIRQQQQQIDELRQEHKALIKEQIQNQKQWQEDVRKAQEVQRSKFDKEQKLQEGLLRKTVNKTERSKIQSQIEKRESLQMQFDDKVKLVADAFQAPSPPRNLSTDQAFRPPKWYRREKIVDLVSKNSIRVRWVGPAVEKGITHYTIHYSGKGESENVDVPKHLHSSFIGNLASNTIYGIYMTSHSTHSVSGKSNVIEVKTK